MSTTAGTIITGALNLIGVVDPEDVPSAAMSAEGLRRLNLMMGQWSLQPLTIPVVAREVFDLVANQTSYTIGVGGDFNTTRPNAFTGAALLLTASDPDVEVPLPIITDDGYQMIQVKALTSGQPTVIYYRPTFSSDLGTVIPWPVPNVSTNDLVLYRLMQLAEFTTLTSTYQIPPGAAEAIEYNLAVRLAQVYTVPMETRMEIRDMASKSLAIFKRSNTKLTDLPIDPAFTQSRHGGYNIQTGTGD